MKTSFTILLLLVFTGFVAGAEEEIGSVEDVTDPPPPDPLLHRQEEEREDEEEEEEEKRKRGVGRIHIDSSISEERTSGGRTDSGDAAEAARLPKPEALQGGPQTLQGLHIGRIPPSCSFCSRERNLCRIISGIFTRSPLPYGYSLVTPIPAGVCNLSITEMKPSKNFFALRRPDGTYVLNGNWDIQAAGQYLIGGTTFTYTPSDEDSGEQLSAPGPLREPIELMLISQSPNPGIKYEYRVPLQEYVGGSPSGLGPQTGGILPNMGGVSGTRGHSTSTFPQGSTGIGTRNPSLGLRTPTSGTGSTGIIPGGRGNQPLVPGRIPFGPNNPNIVAGTYGSLNPGITPAGGINRGRGLGGFNPANVPIQRGSSQSGIGIKPAGPQGRNPGFTGSQPRVPVTPPEGLGTRGSSGIPGVLPHIQPITPLGTSQGSSSLPLPWNPSFSRQDSSQLPVGSPFIPSQAFPRVPSAGSLPSGGTFPGQLTGDGARPNISGSGTTGLQGFLPPRDGSTTLTGVPPEFPKNSVPLRPVVVPIPANPGSRRLPTNVPTHVRRPHSGEQGQLDAGTPSGTHRTRHHHGGKRRRQGHRKGSSSSSSSSSSRTSAEETVEPPFGAGIQQTQPNISPASPSAAAASNGTALQKGPRRRGGGGRRRQQQNDSGTTGGGRSGRRKDRTGRRKQASRYRWAEKGFTPCTKSCGGGNQTTILSCERRRKKTVVSDRRCEHLPRPKTHTIMCNLKPCPAAWAPGEWGPCSVTCGMGVQTRPLVCKQQISPTFIMMVPEGACLLPPSVSTSQVCEMGRCPSTSPEWDSGPWSNCSAPCGLGRRTREVRCVLSGKQVPDDTCGLETQPVEEQVCDMGSCATNTWFFSEWADQCSESCGTGVQTRRVHCLVSAQHSSDEECPAEARPDASRTCRGDSGCGGQWFVGPWGDCSSPCGVGRETRSVICVVVTRKGKWKVVDNDQCISQPRPYDSQDCNVEPCAPQWYTSEWSQCSASCEGGVMRREVTCLDANLRPSADCFNSTKPAHREPCHLHPCNATNALSTPAAGSPSAITSVSGESGDESKTGSPKDRTTEEEEGEEEEVEEEEEGVDPEGYEGASEEIENELVVEEVSGSALNVIPDKDAQGDESVVDEDEGEEEREREEEEEAEKKKKKRKRKKNKDKSGEHLDEEEGERESKQSELTSRPPPPTERTSCIDRIKNCHLVFRARLCRLKYYNKLCCRTCSTS